MIDTPAATTHLDTQQAALSPASTAPQRTSTTRVLHVINGEHYSGAERVQDLLAGYLPACGYDAHFVCVKPGRFPASRKFVHARLYSMPMQSRWDMACGRRIAQLIHDEQYALVHAHTPRSLMAASQAAKAAGAPLVYHVHSPAGRDSTRWAANWINLQVERRLARGAARLIAVSESIAAYMSEQGFSRRQIVCVSNGVPTIDVPPRTAAPASWTLGMTALFRPRKGIEVLLEALADVRSRGGDVRLRAIGPFETPEYEAEVRSLAAKLNIDKVIHWTGFITDIPAELAKVDALLLPSLFGEGLPMVVLEAMAAGVPVIATRVEGVPTAVRDGAEGLLVEPNNPASLAAAIDRLVRGEVDYPALSAAAQERHRAHFSAETMSRRVADVYDDVLHP